MFSRLCLSIALASVAFPAHASHWYIGSGTAATGGAVSIPIWISGDGSTSDAQIDIVFDEARLRLPVAHGDLPGAAMGANSYCVRTTSNAIRLFKLSGGGAPLAAGWTQVCSVTFTVASNANVGVSPLKGVDASCGAHRARKRAP